MQSPLKRRYNFTRLNGVKFNVTASFNEKLFYVYQSLRETVCIQPNLV